jgi:hypothetical protein
MAKTPSPSQQMEPPDTPGGFILDVGGGGRVKGGDDGNRVFAMEHRLRGNSSVTCLGWAA